MPKFAHSLSVVVAKGKKRYLCSCGGKSGWFDEPAEMSQWVLEHAGIRETKQPERRVDGYDD